MKKISVVKKSDPGAAKPQRAITKSQPVANPSPAVKKARPSIQSLPYTVIKFKAQYESYQTILDYLNSIKKKTRDVRDTIELLTLLTEKWEKDQLKKLPETNPVELLKHLIHINNLRPANLATELGVSKSLVSDILNFRRGISKTVTRKLANRFKVPEELFNKPYKLKG